MENDAQPAIWAIETVVIMSISAIGWILKVYHTIAKVIRQDRAGGLQAIVEVIGTALKSFVAALASASVASMTIAIMIDNEITIKSVTNLIKQETQETSVDDLNVTLTKLDDNMNTLREGILGLDETLTGMIAHLLEQSASRDEFLEQLEVTILEIRDDVDALLISDIMWRPVELPSTWPNTTVADETAEDLQPGEQFQLHCYPVGDQGQLPEPGWFMRYEQRYGVKPEVPCA